MKRSKDDGLPSQRYELRQLALLFLTWKLLLLIAACGSPGVGYDTSTRILFDQQRVERRTWIGNSIEHTVLRLTRWDGIYFAASAKRGHVNEQDWAFSWALSRVVDMLTTTLFRPLPTSSIVKHALCSVLVSHASHLLTVFVLYWLALELLPRSTRSRQRVAFTTAALHIVSPAGIFLSAPNAESVFAFFNFLGTLGYVYATKFRTSSGQSFPAEVSYTTLAGLCFGIATLMRSNGLLSGAVFIWDVLESIRRPRIILQSTQAIVRLVATILAGVLVGVGFAIPQVIAYIEYCTQGDERPWCNSLPPSIYSWVQSHYWGVGFLRYWTVSNIPLILLAGPMLGILFATGIVSLREPNRILDTLPKSDTNGRDLTKAGLIGTSDLTSLYRRLAIPQLLLAWMTATTFHIQIINRISSGYPLWYIILAIWLQPIKSDAGSLKTSDSSTYKSSKATHMEWIVRGMIMYAIVQGGLYACFLPPA